MEVVEVRVGRFVIAPGDGGFGDRLFVGRVGGLAGVGDILQVAGVVASGEAEPGLGGGVITELADHRGEDRVAPVALVGGETVFPLHHIRAHLDAAAPAGAAGDLAVGAALSASRDQAFPSVAGAAGVWVLDLEVFARLEAADEFRLRQCPAVGLADDVENLE